MSTKQSDRIWRPLARLLAVVLAVAVVAAACGDDSDDESSGDTADAQATDRSDAGSDDASSDDVADGDGSGAGDAGADSDAPAEPITIGVSFYDAQIIPLYVQMEQGMSEAAAEAGVEVTFSYAAFDPVAQVDQIETMITNEVDIILVTPLDPNVLLPAYESARAAGIPIVSFANKVQDDAEDLFIGSDWTDFGAFNMNTAAEVLGGEGNVAFVTGPPELAVVQMVRNGWESVIAANPGLNVADTLVAPDMSQNVALDLANTLFASNPDIQAVLCTIDQMCLGVAQAASEFGIDPDSIFIASMDADQAAVDQVRDGTGIDQTFSMKGVTWGIQAIDVAVAYVGGDIPTEHRVENEWVRIGPDNAADITDEDLQ